MRLADLHENKLNFYCDSYHYNRFIFCILSMFVMPTSLIKWIAANIALGAIPFISYLVIASRCGFKNKIRNPLNKMTA